MKGKFNLVCVSHPDDETIFFGGLIQRRQSRPWKIICVTDGNADGQGQMRHKQFKKACSRLGASEALWWEYPDIYAKRLPVDEIAQRLQDEMGGAHEIFTHGPLGEYGHPHHQDVSYAVHKAFEGHPRLYAVAYNALPELQIQLTAKEYALKTDILTNIYGSETIRFLNLLPATSSEGFLKLDPGESQALYEFLAHGRPLKAKQLKAHRWMLKYLKDRPQVDRPF